MSSSSRAPHATAGYAQSTASSAQRVRPASAVAAASSGMPAASAAAAAASSEGASGSARRPTPLSGGSSSSSGSVSKRNSVSAASSHRSDSASARDGGSGSAGASFSRVQQLLSKSAVLPSEPYSSTRLAYIPLELLRVTAEAKSALNLLQPGKTSYWSTGSGQNHELVFKITSSCLAGFVKVLNRSTSHIEILISMNDVASQYVQIQSDLHCPHNKTVMYPTGFLPARFVKIKCRRGTPISLFNVSLVGVLERVVWREMGPDMGHTIVEHPEALLLPAKPAMPTSSAPAFPSQQTIKEPVHRPQPPIKQVTR